MAWGRILALGIALAASPALAQGAGLAVGPDAGGYLCPDGRQVYVKSCYDNSPGSTCGVIYLNQRTGGALNFQVDTVRTRPELLKETAGCALYPVAFVQYDVKLVLTAKPIVQPTAPSATAQNNAAQAVAAFSEGQRLKKAYDEKGAIASLNRAIQLDPTYVPAWILLGEIKGRGYGHEDSLPYYQKALALQPQNPEAADKLCFASQLAKRPDLGLPACSTLLGMRIAVEVQVNTYSSLGALYAIKGDHTKSLEAYLQALKLDPNEATRWVNAAASYTALNRNQDALTSLDNALMLRPGDKNTLAVRGDALRRAKRYDDAIRSYNEALSVSGNDPEYRAGIALVLKDAGRKAESDAAYKAATDEALKRGRTALAAYKAGGLGYQANLMSATGYQTSLERWDKAAAAKLDAEIKAAR